MQTITVGVNDFVPLIRAASGTGAALIYNPGPTTVFLTDAQVGNPSTVDSVPLAQGNSVSSDGTRDIYAFTLATPQNIYIMEGITSFFQPTARITAGQFLAGGANSGMYVYNGIPGSAPLIGSITEGFTDPFGTSTIQGLSAYSPLSSAIALVNNALNFYNWNGAGWSSFASLTPDGRRIALNSPGGFVIGNDTNSVEFLSPSADATGGTDLPEISGLLANGCTVILMPGEWYINGTLDITVTSGLYFMPGAEMRTGSAWAGPDSSGCMIHVQADSVTIDHANLRGTGVTSAGQCGGISVTGAQHVRIIDPFLQQMSWYAIAPQASVAGAPCLDFICTNPVIRTCAGGIRNLSNAAASFHGEYFYTNVQLQQIGAATGFGANLDAFLLQDIEDVLTGKINVGVVAGNGSAIHYTGASDSCAFGYVDIGGNTGPTLLIDTTATNSPGYLGIGGGTIQSGSQCISAVVGPGGVPNTALLILMGIRCHQSVNSAVQLQSNITAILTACIAESSNQSGSAGMFDYDFSGLTSAATVEVNACLARTTINAVPTAGNVSAAMAVTSQVFVDNCKLVGGGTNPSNALSGTPRWIRGTAPVNPRGNISAPLITVGSFSPSASQYDMMIVFTAVNGMTDFQIGGTSLGVVPLAGAPIFIGARQVLTVVSAGTPPTWKWFAN